MRKIKVAMLAAYSKHSKRSGSVIHIEKTIRYLSYRDDVELHVITLSNKNVQFKKGDLNVHEIKKSLPYPFSIPSLLWFLRRKMIKINPDIVHAEGTGFSYSTAAALVRDRYPTLLTVMGVILKVKSEDVEELSSKMVKLLTDDKLREEMGKAAMEKAKEYDWNKIADRKVEIYKTVIVDFHEQRGKGRVKT